MNEATKQLFWQEDANGFLLYEYATGSFSYGTTSTWGGYEAKTSTTYSGDGGKIGPYMAFIEGIPTTAMNDAWSATSTTNQWIQLRLDKPKVLKTLGICPRNAFYNNTFKTAHLLASNDGSSFITLADLKFDVQPTSSDEVFFAIDNKQKSGCTTDSILTSALVIEFQLEECVCIHDELEERC